MKREAIRPGSGNVFADLGLSHPEGLRIRAELVHRIGNVIEAGNSSPARAAATLGLSQARFSALMRGRFSGVSVERLFRFLNVLGHDVRITVRPAPEGRAATTRVVQA